MSNCLNYNCSDPLDDYEENDCQDLVLGGKSAMIVLYCNHTVTDPSNATQITSNINAGTAKLITGISATIEAVSPIQVDPLIPCQTQRLVNYDRTGLYRNQNVSSSNDEFHNLLFNGQNFGGLILYNCSPDRSGNNSVDWIDAAVNFVGGKISPPNNNELQRYEATFAWRSLNGPISFPAPAGIFD